MPFTYQSIVVNAPLQKVWDTVSDFHDFSWARDVIEKCEAQGDTPGTEPGAKRVLNDAFHETLIEWNPEEHRIRYSIDDGPSPVSEEEVSDYVGHLHLLPVTEDDATFVEWSSSWESSSQDAVAFCHNIYVALLSSLAAKFKD